MIDLVDCARLLVKDGKGFLAIDERIETANKRLSEHGIEPSPKMRLAFRELFLGADGIEQYLSGAILFSETFGQKIGGKKFPAYLASRGIEAGIKVDLGTEPFEGGEELITNGVLGLPKRLAAFRKEGARFSKWRAVIRIDGDRLPSAQAVAENARRLAAYAHESQEAGIVPILEPEVLLSGKHSRLRARAVITETLTAVFEVVKEHVVDLASLLVKTSMALSGSESGRNDTPEEVAEDTLAALLSSVPRQVAGIVFLSGGQSPDQATTNLSAIARKAKEKNAPWPVSFSFARALQDEALAVWQGKDENVPAARGVFLARLEKVFLASSGTA